MSRSMLKALILALPLALNSVPKSAGSQVSAPSGDRSIVSQAAVLERVFSDGFFTEGPAVAPDGTVFFTDITITESTGMQAGHIWRFDPATGSTTIFRSPSGMANGLQFDGEGRLLAAEGADFGGRRITRTDLTSGKAYIVAAQFDGRLLNSPNDLTVDTAGRIYFTDPRYFGHESVEQAVHGVYRIDPDGSIHLIIADSGKPNGIAISPDGSTLYVVAHDDGTVRDTPVGVRARQGRMALLAYDLASDGTASFREAILEFSAPRRAPDGIKVDRRGNLWITDTNRPYGIRVFTPDARELAFIPTPEVARNLAFGHGPNARTLYITAGGSLYRIEVEQEGYHPFRW
jgi:gluconolactonase